MLQLEGFVQRLEQTDVAQHYKKHGSGDRSNMQHQPSDESLIYTPSAFRISSAIVAVTAFIFSSDSASTITRASDSVPE